MRVSISIQVLFYTIFLFSCNKFVDITPKGRLVPSTVADYRKLLDDNSIMNVTGGLADISSDDLVFSDIEYNQMSFMYEKQAYVWEKTLFDPLDNVLDWNYAYRQVYIANLVLEGLEKDNRGTRAEKDMLKGEALFFRANAIFNVLNLFCEPYDPATAAARPGAPIRLKADIFPVSVRPTLQESYDQVLKDLQEALTLLPATAASRTRPAKTAALALLSRHYLGAGNYDKALEFGLEVLKLNNKVLDFNDLDPFGFPIFPKLHEEILFYGIVGYETFSYAYSSIDLDLYQQYDDTDLRKFLYFMDMSSGGAPDPSYNGSYGGDFLFTGIANDEVYLTIAECYARKNQLTEALDYLDKLLQKRIDRSSYVPYASADPLEVLNKILLERRKELVYRGIRWFDLRRLNKDPRFAKTITRTVVGKQYSLPAGDKKYTLPIPQNVIAASGIPQNER